MCIHYLLNVRLQQPDGRVRDCRNNETVIKRIITNCRELSIS